MTKPKYRSGFIGVVGRTNVGKSTLINTFAHAKVAITSRKPQTTRNTIRCIITEPDYQAVFVDTPGFHKPHNLLGQRLNKMIVSTLADVDAVLFLIDGTHDLGLGEQYVMEHIRMVKTPVVVAMNKMDKLTNREVQEREAAIAALGGFAAVIPISARTGRNVDLLLAKLAGFLPEGPLLYPEDMLTDQPEKFIVAEYIREKILELTRKEVPHSVAVVVEEMSERPGKELIDIEAAIYVERDTQKGIIIGKGGGMLKEIGTRARRDIETMLGTKVNLRLWVGVEKDWRTKEGAIQRLTEDDS
jgi:GTPase